MKSPLMAIMVLALVGAPVLQGMQEEQKPLVRIRASATATAEGFRIVVDGTTDYPEGAFLDLAFSRRPALQIDDRFYQPLQVLQTMRTGKDGVCSITFETPESFILPGRYDLTVTFLPEKQIQNTGKIMAERELPLKEHSARAGVTLVDPERFTNVMGDDLEDFVKISAVLRDINRIVAAAPDKSADEKARKQLFKGMDDLSEAMRRSDNRSYLPHVRAEVAIYISYIPKLKFVTTQKPDYVKEEDEALEKHNQKMIKEGKENAVIKQPEERVILEETTEKIQTFFLCSYASEIMDGALRVADLLKEAAEGQLQWKAVEASAKREIAAVRKVAEGFDRSSFGESARALFRAEDTLLLTRVTEEIAAIHAAMDEAQRTRGSLPDAATLRKRFAVVDGWSASFRKIVDERLVKYRPANDAEKAPPPEAPTPENAPPK